MRASTLRAPALAVVAVLTAMSAHAAPKKQPAPPPLTPAGETLLAEYSRLLETLRAEVSAALPKIDPALEAAFLAAHADEGPRYGKAAAGSKKKPEPARDSGVYKDFKRQRATMSQARPIFATIAGFLGRDAIDKSLVRCAVLANATPRGLAAYAEQGPEHKARIDALLADENLMHDMLVAGGAKAGRYGKAMEILAAIHAASPRSRDGILGRLALATALELAAPELCGYTTIDPVKRYLSYEQWYLAKELDPHFADMTTWECRHIINDDQPDDMLAWLRTMVRNYRPDTVATTYPRDKYMAVNGDIPQTTPEYDDDLARLQAVVCNGGRCGPKAGLGRATTRAFGIPTWGARVKAHTGMTSWTPHGWTAALGVAFNGSYWDRDLPERMWSTVFRLDQMARENRAGYSEALRCGWIGDALGQDRIDGLVSGTGGFWHALALNKKRLIVADAWPDYQGDRVPWCEDGFALAKDYPKRPEDSAPLVTPEIGPEDRRIEVAAGGTITIPAAACVTPAASTAKILFMESALGGVQLHYRRKGAPESFVYEVTAPAAGDYLLSAKVVTINRDQSLRLTLNDQDPAIAVPLPYTIGMWEDSKPVKVRLQAGRNTLSFTRSVPAEFAKHVWTRSGPDYGGVSIRCFVLQPAAR